MYEHLLLDSELLTCSQLKSELTKSLALTHYDPINNRSKSISWCFLICSFITEKCNKCKPVAFALGTMSVTEYYYA